MSLWVNLNTLHTLTLWKKSRKSHKDMDNADQMVTLSYGRVLRSMRIWSAFVHIFMRFMIFFHREL